MPKTYEFPDAKIHETWRAAVKGGSRRCIVRINAALTRKLAEAMGPQTADLLLTHIDASTEPAFRTSFLDSTLRFEMSKCLVTVEPKGVAGSAKLEIEVAEVRHLKVKEKKAGESAGLRIEADLVFPQYPHELDAHVFDLGGVERLVKIRAQESGINLFGEKPTSADDERQMSIEEGTA